MAFELLYTRVFHRFTDFPDELARLLKVASTHSASNGDPFNGQELYDITLNREVSRINVSFGEANVRFIHDMAIEIYTGDGSARRSESTIVNRGNVRIHVYNSTDPAGQKNSFRLYTLADTVVYVALAQQIPIEPKQEWWSIRHKDDPFSNRVIQCRHVDNEKISGDSTYTMYNFVSDVLQTNVFRNLREYVIRAVGTKATAIALGRSDKSDTEYDLRHVLFDRNMLSAAAIYLDVMSRGRRWYDRLKEIHANPDVMREEAVNCALEKVHRKQIHYSWLANALLAVYFIRSLKPARQQLNTHASQDRSVLNVAYRIMLEGNANALNREIYCILFGTKYMFASDERVYVVYSKEALLFMTGNSSDVGAAAADIINMPSTLDADAKYEASRKSSFDNEDTANVSETVVSQFNTAKTDYNTKYVQYEQKVQQLKAAASAYAAIKTSVVDKYNNLANLLARGNEIVEKPTAIETVEWPEIIQALGAYVAEKGRKWTWPRNGSDDLILRAMQTIRLMEPSLANNNNDIYVRMAPRRPYVELSDNFDQQRNELLTVLFQSSTDGISGNADKLKSLCERTSIFHQPSMLPITSIIKRGGVWWDRPQTIKYTRTAALRCADVGVVTVVALQLWNRNFYNPREALEAYLHLEPSPDGRLCLKIVSNKERQQDTDPALEGRLLFQCITDGDRDVLSPFLATTDISSKFWVRGASFPMFRAISRSSRVAIEGDARDFTLSLDYDTRYRCTDFFGGPNFNVSLVPAAVVSDEGTERYAQQVLDAVDGHGVQRRVHHNIVTSVGDAAVDYVVEEFLSTHVFAHERQREISHLLLHRWPNDDGAPPDPMSYNCLIWWRLRSPSAASGVSVVSAVLAGLLSFKIAVLKFRKTLAKSMRARIVAIPGISEQKLKVLGIKTPLPSNNLYTQVDDCHEDYDPSKSDAFLNCVLNARPFTPHKLAANKAKTRRLYDEDAIARKRMRVC